MGGMAIMAFAERHPEVFEARVAGVALVSTTAGGLKTHHIVSRLIPDSIGGEIGARLIAGLALAPDLVDRVRRRGSNVGFLVADQFAFGEDVPDSYVEFVNNMLAETSFEVLAQFFPNFDSLDKFHALGAFAPRPDVHRLRHQGRAHLGRPQPQDGRSGSRAPPSSSARAPGTW